MLLNASACMEEDVPLHANMPFVDACCQVGAREPDETRT
jgi:hypothetical protein